MSIREVVPVQHESKSTRRLYLYKRIKVEALSGESLRKIYSLINLKREVRVLDTPNYFLIQYEGKPVIVLGRKDGRVCGIEGDGFTQEQREHQASIVIRILKPYGLVEDLHFKRSRT